MLDKLFRKAAKTQKAKQEEQKKASSDENKEDAMDETGTFMLDVSQLQDSEELEDLLKDL